MKLPCRGRAQNIKCAALRAKLNNFDMILTQNQKINSPMVMTFDLNPRAPDSPCGAWLDAQHVPGVLAVADASNGVGLLFSKAHADFGHWALPSVLAHVGDRREERLQQRTQHYNELKVSLEGACACRHSPETSR